MEGVEKCRFCKQIFTSKNAKRCVKNHEMLVSLMPSFFEWKILNVFLKYFQMHLIKGEVLPGKKVPRKSIETKKKVDFEYENEIKEKKPKREVKMKVEKMEKEDSSVVKEVAVAGTALFGELDGSQFPEVTEEFFVEELEESVEDDSKIVEEDQEPQAYRCRFCDRLFETKHARRCVKYHELKVHSKEMRLEKSFKATAKLEQSQEFSCSFCGRLFTGSGAKRNCKCHELKMHIMREEGTFNCAYCPDTLTFDSWADCNKHEIQVHSEYWKLFAQENQ